MKHVKLKFTNESVNILAASWHGENREIKSATRKYTSEHTHFVLRMAYNQSIEFGQVKKQNKNIVCYECFAKTKLSIAMHPT